MTFFLRRDVRLALAWYAACAASLIALVVGWKYFDIPAHPLGNDGHVRVDFGGQWLLARSLIEGNGPVLYDRLTLRALAVRHFTEADGGRLMDAMVGEDGPLATRLGGPPYPPIQPVLYAPLALLSPAAAYRLLQIANVALAWVCGWLVHRLTRGRVWWPAAVALLMMFPGYGGAVNLAQNPMLSLTLLLLGWSALTRGRPVRAGVLWGMLAFKPVWAVAFFFVPVLTRRWRMAAAMAATGLGLVAVTLPFVGWRAWADWVEVGKMATELYSTEQKWIFGSRDLAGAPRRMLLDFAADGTGRDRHPPWATVLGWCLRAGVLAITAVVAWRRRGVPPIDGPAAAFVLLGCYLSCLHFMYYDALLAVLPVALVFARRWYAVPATLLGLMIALTYLGGLLDRDFYHPPWDTYGLLLMWAWCGFASARSDPD